MSTQWTMITRWPCRVPSRPTSKITTYGWSTNPEVIGGLHRVVGPHDAGVERLAVLLGAGAHQHDRTGDR